VRAGFAIAVHSFLSFVRRSHDLHLRHILLFFVRHGEVFVDLETRKLQTASLGYAVNLLHRHDDKDVSRLISVPADMEMQLES